MRPPLFAVPSHVDVAAVRALVRRLVDVTDEAGTGYGEAWLALLYAAEIIAARGYNFTEAARSGWKPPADPRPVPETSLDALARFIAKATS